MLPRQQGVSLIELMIGLVILGIVAALGVPSYTQWIQNGQIRAATESMQSGLQLARSNAVRMNQLISIQVNSLATGVTWRISCVTVTATCPATIESWSGTEGAANVRAGANQLAAAGQNYASALPEGSGSLGVVIFNGTGRVANAGAAMTRIDVLNPKLAAADQRRLVLVIAPGGSIRMCDPQAAAGLAWACT